MATKLIKGKKNIIRGVKLRVGKNEWERPVQAVCPMEIKACVPVATDKDIVTEIGALPKRRAKDPAKDALVVQTLLRSEKWERVKEICTLYRFRSDSKFLVACSYARVLLQTSSFIKQYSKRD